MASSPVAFVLVPPSYCKGAIYERLSPLLQGAGYVVETLDNPSNDQSRASPATLQDDADHCRTAVLRHLDAGRDVVLILNSYGGFPGTEGMHGLSRAERQAAGHTTAVTHLVFLSAFLENVGTSMRDYMARRFGSVPEGFGDDPDVPYMPLTYPPAEMANNVFNDLEHEEGQRVVSAYMVPHSRVSFAGRLTHASWHEIPTTFVLCRHDQVLPVDIQQGMIDAANASLAKHAKPALRVVEIESDHVPQISHPTVVRDLVVDIAQGAKTG